ncbi:MAG TPA: bacterial transcriptional activator domain-containing protein [Blastocatellia bacterium]|nr:bacterial transcriptional activator domain-containing protein [Blastocatellia bacterium]
MAGLRISLLGRLCVRRDELVIEGTHANKIWEFFCYLLLHQDHPHPREVLAAMLWGNSPTAQSKKYLRQALWQLQSCLNSQGSPAGDRLLQIEPDWVLLNSKADFWLDVAVFEQAFNLAHGVTGRDLDSQQARALREAVELYRGDLLEGWYQDWCLYERERLQNIYITILEKLMDHCEAHREYETGLGYGERILRCDRAREGTQRRQMRLQYLAGDRTAALRQYQACVDALEAELGVKPDKSTTLLYEQIRADYLSLTPSPPAAAPPADGKTDSLSKVLGTLKQLNLILNDVKRQIAQEIQTVEQILQDRR